MIVGCDGAEAIRLAERAPGAVAKPSPEMLESLARKIDERLHLYRSGRQYRRDSGQG